jgi:hypothetical protein
LLATATRSRWSRPFSRLQNLSHLHQTKEGAEGFILALYIGQESEPFISGKRGVRRVHLSHLYHVRVCRTYPLRRPICRTYPLRRPICRTYPLKRPLCRTYPL